MGQVWGHAADSDSLAGSSSGRTRGLQGHGEDTAGSQQAAEQADSDEEARHTSHDVQSDREDAPSTHGPGARQAHTPMVSLKRPCCLVAVGYKLHQSPLAWASYAVRSCDFIRKARDARSHKRDLSVLRKA